MKDLFGNPVTEEQVRAMKKKKGRGSTQPRGYAAKPGTGPEGETCGSCRYKYARDLAKTYLKCLLTYAAWTGGGKTDIRASAPACAKWTALPPELVQVRKDIRALRRKLPKQGTYFATSTRDGWIYKPSIGGSPYKQEIQDLFKQGEALRKLEHKLELEAGMLPPAPPRPITGAR